VGTQLGRYYLAAQVASGGMATVFLATVSGPGGFEKVNAVKRIHPHLAEEEAFVEMFLDEARIASRIHHANVCQVFDFGESDGTYFIAMEYLMGEPLSRTMKTVRKNFEQLDSARLPMIACKIIADACEGLHAAHELKGRDGASLEVVHRDVSPQNLFVTFDGNVKVVDFGIASASDRVHHTTAGQVKGKFSYMAPEQSRGGALDRRADVWALGVVLWEMLTLRRLFRRDTTVATLTAMLGEPIPPPSAYRPSLDERLDEIVLKALSRDPDQRYPTAREFGRDLSRYAGSTGEPADAAELAEWMDEIFPDGRQQVRSIMDAAQRGEVDETIVTSHLEVSESEVEAVDVDLLPGVAAVEIRAAQTAETQVAPVTETPATLSTEVAEPAAAPAGGRPMLYAALGAAAVLLLVAIGGAVGWAAMSGGSVDVPPPTQVATVAQPAVEPHENETPEPVAPDAGDEEPPAEDAGVVADPDDSLVRPAGMRRGRNPGAMRRRPAMTETPPPTMESAATEGTAFITTPGGWANVYDESGRHLGQTPLRLTLSVGTHRLRLRPLGQPPDIRVRVNVTGEGTARVVQRLD